MAIIGIVAIAQNFAIGRCGKLPWHYSADLKFFKETTTGKTVVMGRKTFDSIGKPLPNRLNVVLSRSNAVNPKLISVQNEEAVLDLSRYLTNDLFIIGGASLYELFSDTIEKWIVTEIPETIRDADTFMPKNFLESFELMGSKVLEGNISAKFYTRKP